MCVHFPEGRVAGVRWAIQCRDVFVAQVGWHLRPVRDAECDGILLFKGGEFHTVEQMAPKGNLTTQASASGKRLDGRYVGKDLGNTQVFTPTDDGQRIILEHHHHVIPLFVIRLPVKACDGTRGQRGTPRAFSPQSPSYSWSFAPEGKTP